MIQVDWQVQDPTLLECRRVIQLIKNIYKEKVQVPLILQVKTINKQYRQEGATPHCLQEILCTRNQE